MAEGNWSRFTAAEGGARLAAAARTRNTIAAELAAFTATRLLHEEAHGIRGPFSAGKQRSIFVTRASRVPCAAYELRILTDLAVASASVYGDIEDWTQEVEVKEVIVCTSTVFRQLLEDGIITMTRVNVLVVDSCHLVHTDEDLQTIMDLYKSSPSQPRVLGLTYPLFPAKRSDPDAENTPDEKEESCAKQITEGSLQEFGVCENVDDFEMYSKLEWNIRRLEERLCSQMDLAEDMDGGKRFTGAPCKPKELIVEYAVSRPVCSDYEELENFMRTAVNDVTEFLEEHRYDPTEIYGEDLYEEFMNIPNPTIDPKLIFKQFLYVLDELGPYGADKAAFSLLTKLEKLKIKVPYERHFLLLCLCTTVLVKIRCYSDLMFSKYSELDRITTFSTAKVLRFIEILAQFENNYSENDKSDEKAVTDKNEINNDENQSEKTDSVTKDDINDKVTLNGYKTLNSNEIHVEKENDNKNLTKKMLDDIEKCDFVALSNKIEDKVNTYEANLKEIHDLSIDLNKLDVKKESNTKTEITEVKATEMELTDPRSLLFPRRMHRVRGRGRVQRNVVRNQQAQMNPDALCGIVFMNEPIMAKIMFLVVVDLSRFEPRLSGVSAQYVASGGAADTTELRRHARAREDALKKFRMHDCNLLLATSALEEGIDLPRCNLVLRWDVPASYRSHGLCRGRARAPRAACALLAGAGRARALLRHVAVYRELDQIISRKCGCGIQDEPPQQEEDHADAFTALVIPYSPSCNKKRSSVDKECCGEEAKKEDIASVDLSSAIALINRYCGKLPSDTFTRLAPSYRTERVHIRSASGVQPAWVCTLRLPLNCPVKYNIVGHPMPTRVLARRMAALQACRILHKSGELDDHLMPIGKENFKAGELEACAEADARPGTTKRRQYYYKRTARAFTNCEPIVDTTDEQLAEEADGQTEPIISNNVLYAISCTLWCALPERYNTRGRRLHAPQLAKQACGVLMRVQQPDRLQIPSFPVYTRSGEVRVTVAPAAHADTRLSPRRKQLITRFMRFVFADVLRVRRRGMTLEPEACTHNNYYVVPTVKVNNPDGSTKVDIDWKFLEQIYQYTEEKAHDELEKPVLWTEEGRRDEEKRPGEGEVWARKDDGTKSEHQDKRKVKKMDNPLLKPGEIFVFDPEKYREAVVTPWYRNQDQPQFFLVAEICSNLTPDSEFPSDTHTSFRDYYNSKYGVTLTQPNQPLLDVDHTSARLNLLTPRYVNRKGVALPVSSERTRRAKRDRLDQKQILVPELCTVHPFAAPLWFATVALPCVLYRINALLIADEIRRGVAAGVALGVPRVGPGFQWPPLDFGWSLAEVLSADSEKNEKRKENEEEPKDEDEMELEKEREHEEKKETEEPKEKTLNDILQEKEDAESGFEIGTWDNNMASSIPEPAEFDEFLEPLPPNLTFCTSASGGANWCDPVQKPKSQFNPSRTFSMADSDCSYMSSDFDTDDSDLNSEDSDDTDTSGFCSSRSNAAMGVRIEYKTAHEAEAVDVERRAARPAPQPDRGDDARDAAAHARAMRAGDAPTQCLQQFQQSVAEHEQEIIQKGLLIHQDQPITDILPDPFKDSRKSEPIPHDEVKTRFEQLFPYKNDFLNIENGPITLEAIEKNKRSLLAEFKNSLSEEEMKKYTCFSMIDVDMDSPEYKNEKVSNIGFDTMESYAEKVKRVGEREFKPYYEDSKGQNGKEFDFDFQPSLEGHPGPSPSVILQALTMSNANDGINLERLETIGDSFLKFAITAYLYCAHPTVHEGKLSHMRSKQVSNLNLYRLGLRKRLGARMIASKFEPHDNWLPPCHKAPPAAHAPVDSEGGQEAPPAGCFIPYNLITQHSIPDKSIADCVEALIGAYLLECGPRGALLFMAWLGIRVLPRHDVPVTDHGTVKKLDDWQKKQSARITHRESDSESSDEDDDELPRPVGSLAPYKENNQWFLPMFGALRAPPSPLLRYIADPEGELEQMLSGYDALERTLQYRFKDRSLLLQALTHASHQRNRLTDCYQRLEFLGDAILDYLITRHLYEDPRRHSPGALTDLRSALVNNTIFATLAARHGFHKYFRHMSPGLNEVLTRYVRIQEENGHSISEEHYLIHEDELEQAEDVEVPKALGDLFESIAGAIFLDSGMSLAAVWGSYEQLMGAELEAFSAAAPKSPVRELLEAEPDTAKFGKPERLADGRRVRVCVEVFGRGAFKGVGRNYRIAKGTAARCALRHLKRHKQH
ncbi:endoribonuclease Dcr-1 [Cydia pomonella]|uniref:endoribonuclease Dcr-1 n=1 Tax=Cydia pomonella TaxID=82600 RepID=UPI002ADDA1AD|nr:endoribonuclease Dcr-1 [Cydia pomonella]